jgi:hypothetical protein
MALDFPSSPSNGATSNGFTYSSALGVWTLPAVAADAPAGTAEYVRVNAAWRKRWERFAVSSVASTQDIIMAVPSGAKFARWTDMIFVPTVVLPFVAQFVSYDGGSTYPAAGLAWGGKYHNSGSGAFATVTDAVRTDHPLNSHNAGIFPTLLEGYHSLTRASTQEFKGKVSSHSYNSAAANGHRHDEYALNITSAGYGANLSITHLKHVIGTTVEAGSYVTMEWDYA